VLLWKRKTMWDTKRERKKTEKKGKTSMWAFRGESEPPRRERTTEDGTRARRALLIKMNERLSGPSCRRGPLGPPHRAHDAPGVKRDPDARWTRLPRCRYISWATSFLQHWVRSRSGYLTPYVDEFIFYVPSLYFTHTRLSNMNPDNPSSTGPSVLLQVGSNYIILHCS